jgi:hypothetical protein
MKNLAVCLLLLSLSAFAVENVFAAPAKIPRYAKFEASFTLLNQTGNPYDPQVNDIDVAFTGPHGLQMTVPAFWDGNIWRVRFAPTRVGDYALRITRNGQTIHPADLSEEKFVCVPSNNPGFIHRDPKIVQRFDFDNGQPYYPLGINIAWTGNNTPDYPGYFTDMEQAHLNWARIWMTFWDGKALDWSPDKTKNPPFGTFLLSAAQRWDVIFDQAAQKGIYVQMVLQHHGQYTAMVDPNWGENPFNAANGGFLQKPEDFFTNPEAERLTEAKYRYIVARWGYSTHLLSFELFNEVQNIKEAQSHFQDVVNWHKTMAAYIRSVDADHHLITTSMSTPTNALGDIGLDYDQDHTYPPDPVSVFGSVKTVGVTVPYFYGEWGPPNAMSPSSKPMVHNGLWAGLMTPMAGAAEYWYGDMIARENWWPMFASAGNFVQTYHIPQLGVLEPVTVGVDAPGPRADLSFAPPGGWGPLKHSDITLLADGTLPDMSGVPSYIQGTNHRDMMPQPLTFHLHCDAPAQFQVTIGSVSQNGAHPTLALDGQIAQQADYPAEPKDHDAKATLSVDVPVGDHTVALNNTGQDWFIANNITVTNYVPAVAVIAKGNMHSVVFWAYARPGGAAGPREATLSFPGLQPGRYQIHFWDTSLGQPLGAPKTVALHGTVLRVPLPAITGDLAGVIVSDQRK